MKSLILSAFTILSFSITASAFADGNKDNRTTGERINEVGEDAVKNTKEGARAVKDAVCMEGDVECAMQKAESEAKNIGDEIEDKADDINKSVN